MDPLTRAAQTFARQLAEDWRRAAAVRLVAPASHRTHLVRSLRLFEWSPDNRWPLCLVEAAADDLDSFAEAASRQLCADLVRLREGLAGDGVELGDPDALAIDLSADIKPMARLWILLDRAGQMLARTGVAAGVAFAVVPVRPPAMKSQRHLAAALAAWPTRPHVRLALAVTEPDELVEVLPSATPFILDESALDDYCRQQGERQAAAAPPAEAALRRHFLAASDAARQNDLAAARRAYLAASVELERLDRIAEAAVVHITIGGLAFGLADGAAALTHFDRATAMGTTAGQLAVVAQAHLGAAGVLHTRGEFRDAARRYELAADNGGPGALRIEALRMAGACRLRLGDHDAASRAWSAAVADAEALPAAARTQTTWKQAGESLMALLQRRGQTTQAADVQALLQAGEAR